MTEKQLEGQRRLAAMRARAHRIRIWVTASGVGIFLAVLTGLMGTAQSSSTTTTTQAAATSSAVTQSSSSSSSAADQSADVAPMTTRQS